MHVPSLRSLALGALASLLLGTQPWAADTPPMSSTPDLTRIRATLKAKNYEAALGQLRGIVGTNQTADVFSLMGFALRKTGDRAGGMAYYQRALALDANHKGALEYQGELFVELGQPDKARENQGRLQKLCPSGCEELTDLKEAIERAPKPARP